MNMKPDTAIRTKGSFSLASGFALVNLRWSHGVIEIPYPALFPLPISHPNPIKTQNPAPTSNWNSRFPHLFSAQIPNITAKKSQIPHPAKPIGDPHSHGSLITQIKKVPVSDCFVISQVLSLDRASILEWLNQKEIILSRWSSSLYFHGWSSMVKITLGIKLRLSPKFWTPYQSANGDSQS